MKVIMLLYIIISIGLNINALEIKDYLNSDLTACMFVDFAKLSEKGIIQKIQTKNDENKKDIFKAYQKSTGFKPEKDLKNIYILIPEEVNMNKKSIAFIFDGNFNQKKSVDFFKDLDKKSDIKTKKIKDYDVYISKDDYSFYFKDKNTLIMGGKDFLTDIINNKKTVKKEDEKKNDFENFFIESKNNSFSGIFKLSDENKSKASKIYPKSDLIKDIISFDFKSDIDKNISILLNINTKSSDSAQKLKDILMKLKFAGIMYGAKAGLSQMISKIEISSEKEKTVLNIGLTSEDISILRDMSKKFNKKGISHE